MDLESRARNRFAEALAVSTLVDTEEGHIEFQTKLRRSLPHENEPTLVLHSLEDISNTVKAMQTFYSRCISVWWNLPEVSLQLMDCLETKISFDAKSCEQVSAELQGLIVNLREDNQCLKAVLALDVCSKAYDNLGKVATDRARDLGGHDSVQKLQRALETVNAAVVERLKAKFHGDKEFLSLTSHAKSHISAHGDFCATQWLTKLEAATEQLVAFAPAENCWKKDIPEDCNFNFLKTHAGPTLTKLGKIDFIMKIKAVQTAPVSP